MLKLPSDFSSPLFHEVSDGDGWSLVLYYKITEVVTSTKIVLSRSCYYIQLVSVFRMHRELFCMKFLQLTLRNFVGTCNLYYVCVCIWCPIVEMPLIKRALL